MSVTFGQEYTISRSIALNLTDIGAIVVIKGDALGSIFRIRGNSKIILGRNPMKCDLVIHGDKISRIHCSITYLPVTHRYQVTDHSSNGCYLSNGSRLRKEEINEFESGTELMLGDEENIIKLG